MYYPLQPEFNIFQIDLIRPIRPFDPQLLNFHTSGSTLWPQNVRLTEKLTPLAVPSPSASIEWCFFGGSMGIQNKVTHFRRFAFIGCIVLWFAGATAFGQGFQGGLRGAVRDPGGAL